MRPSTCLILALSCLLPWSSLRAAETYRGRGGLEKLNSRLHGYVVDYTHNHGTDNRLYSQALHEKRDLYVYVPPGFDPHKCYPVLLWLHGFAQDEVAFLRDIVVPLDEAMGEGKLPPIILASPDGSFHGRETLCQPGSGFLNTRAGNFEDYLMNDVWSFLLSNYPVLPERSAHIVAGVSLGGGAAYNKAIKFKDQFGIVMGVFPAVNLRWEDCHGRYASKFDPDCWGWRTNFDHFCEVIARYYKVITIRQGQLIRPLFGRHNPDTAALISRENPIEMLTDYGVREGELAMYIAYGGQDEFHIDAQVESFLFRARQLGLTIDVEYSPEGHHDRKTARAFTPSLLEWLNQQLAPCKLVPHPGVS